MRNGHLTNINSGIVELGQTKLNKFVEFMNEYLLKIASIKVVFFYWR